MTFITHPSLRHIVSFSFSASAMVVGIAVNDLKSLMG